MEGRFYFSQNEIILKGTEKNYLHELRIEKGKGSINTSYSVTEGDKTIKMSTVSLVGTSDGPINDRDLNAIIDFISKMYKGPVINSFINDLKEHKQNILYKDTLKTAKKLVKKKK